MLLQVALHARVELCKARGSGERRAPPAGRAGALTVGVAVLLAAEEAQVRDGRRAQEVPEVPEGDSGAVYVAGLQFLHGRYHCHRNSALV